MKSIITIVAVLASVALNAQILLGDKTEVTFYSYTPVENISARSTTITEAVNLSTGDFTFKIVIYNYIF